MNKLTETIGKQSGKARKQGSTQHKWSGLIKKANVMKQKIHNKKVGDYSWLKETKEI